MAAGVERLGARDLRRDLLDAAAAVVAEVGPGAVRLREIARRCGVSHAAPAHHFGDLAGLLSALAAEGFRGLAAALSAAEAVDGRGLLSAQGRAYVRYAVGAPGHFRMMFRSELLDEGDPELRAARGAAYAELERAVAAAQADGWAPGSSHDDAVVAAWSSVHGLATLWLDGGLPPHLAARPLDGLAEAVTALVGEGSPPAQPGSSRDTDPPSDST